MKKSKLPSLVRNLCYHCEGYIVGGACLYMLGKTDLLKDYDVVVPFNKWKLASTYSTDDTTINSFGGFKQISDGIEVDYWVDDIMNILNEPYNNDIIYAINPYKNIVLTSRKETIGFY